MKKRLIILVMCVPLLGYTQIILKKDILPLSLKFAGCFSAGVFRSHVEILDNSYGAFQAKWPNANPNRFNPEISWKNKYKNNDPNQGPKFFGSTTVFVGVTDWKHGFQSIEHTLLFTTVTISIGSCRDNELFKQDKWLYLKRKAIECAVMWVGYNAGFTTTRYFYKLK